MGQLGICGRAKHRVEETKIPRDREMSSRRGVVEVRVLSPRMADETGNVRRLNDNERAAFVAAAYREREDEEEYAGARDISTSFALVCRSCSVLR